MHTKQKKEVRSQPSCYNIMKRTTCNFFAKKFTTTTLRVRIEIFVKEFAPQTETVAVAVYK